MSGELRKEDRDKSRKSQIIEIYTSTIESHCPRLVIKPAYCNVSRALTFQHTSDRLTLRLSIFFFLRRVEARLRTNRVKK